MSRETAHDLDEKWRSNDIALEENVDFSSLMLSDRVLNGLRKAGFKKPSPIQLQAIPLGRCGLDLLVQAKSGTGKTCVFTVIALENLLDVYSTQVLILTPTREIATQIRDVVKAIGSGFKDLKCCAFIGGLPLVDDKKSAHDCQIAVGTPGRIRQLISMDALQTESIRLFVVDEADKLLEESFFSDLNWIFSALPENKQVVAASATFPKKLAALITQYMRNPSLVRLNINEISLLGIVQYYCITNFHPVSNVLLKNKFEVLWKILNTVQFSQCLVFCNLITRVETICDDLNAAGFPTASISSYQEQEERLEAIEKLKTFQTRILVTSDLVARGIDAENVDFVINIDLPYDVETYLHRIGRAGRYGSKGIALSLVAENELTSLNKFREQTKLKLYRLPDPVPSNLSNLEPDESQLLPMPSHRVNPPSPPDKIADFMKSNSSESENFLDFLISDQVPMSVSETAEPEPKATNGEYNDNTCEKKFPNIKYSSNEMRNLQSAADSGCKDFKTSDIVTNTENDCSYLESGDSNSLAENGVLENNVIEMEIDYLHESSNGFVVETNVSQTVNGNSNDKLKCLEILDNDIDLMQTPINLGNCLIENDCKNKLQENGDCFSERLSFIPKAIINEECHGEIDAALNKSKILECDSAVNEVTSSIFTKSFVLPNLQENESEFISTEVEATVCSVIENGECEKHAETNCTKSTHTDLNHSEEETEQLKNVEPVLLKSNILQLTSEMQISSQNVSDTTAASTVSDDTKPILSSFERGVVNYYSQVGQPAEEICDDEKINKASTVALENLFPICYHEKLSFEDLMTSYTNFESVQSEYVVPKDDYKATSNKINLTAAVHIIDESCKQRQIFFFKASKSLMEDSSKQEENAKKSTTETISDFKSAEPNFSREPHSNSTKIVNHSTPVHKGKPETSMASSPESVKVSSKLSKVSPDFSKLSSKLSKVAPESSKVTSELTKVAPELTEVAPEPIKVVPELTKVAPELTKTPSESSKISPELTKTSSESLKVSSEFSKSSRHPLLSGLPSNEADSNTKLGSHIKTSRKKFISDVSNQPTNRQITKDSSSTTSSVIPVIEVNNLNSNLDKSKPNYAPSSDDEITHQMMTNYCFDGDEDILDFSNEETMVNECKYDEGKSIHTESEAEDIHSTIEYKAKSKKSDKKFLPHEQSKAKSKYNKSNNKKNYSSKVRKSKNSTKEEHYPATKWLPVTKEHSAAKKSSGSEKSYVDNGISKERKKYAEKYIETPSGAYANNFNVAYPNYYDLTSIPFQNPYYRSYGEHSNVHQNLVPCQANCSRSRQVCCLTSPCIAKLFKSCIGNCHNTNCCERVCLCCLEHKMRACCCDKSPKSIDYLSYQWSYFQNMLRFPH